MPDLNDITVWPENDGLDAECVICGHRRRFTTMHTVVTLNELVEVMRDHLKTHY